MFCVHSQTDPAKYDPLDLDQWSFYVISGKRIAALNQKSIGLGRVKRLTHSKCLDELRQEIERVANEGLSKSDK